MENQTGKIKLGYRNSTNSVIWASAIGEILNENGENLSFAITDNFDKFKSFKYLSMIGYFLYNRPIEAVKMTVNDSDDMGKAQKVTVYVGKRK